MHVRRILFTIMCGIGISTSTIAKFSFKQVSSFFGGNPYEMVIHQEYQLKHLDTLLIENIDGPITIKTGWKKNNTVLLKATKRANKEEDLADISIKASRIDDKKLMIKTVLAHNTVKGSVEYECIVPANINVEIKNNHGNIAIHDIHGPTTATTIKGNIEIYNIKNTVHAQTTKKGNITIQNTNGAVSATTHHGNIEIDNAYDSIIASTTKGYVTVACSQVPTTSAIRLETTAGPISLSLPSGVNATIKGQTAHGTLSSDHYITLRPYTTRLDTLAWNRFKKEVDGTLGTGETEITLRSTYGNVKILETKTT